MKFVIGFIGVVVVVFFLLGLKSQKGKAPGLINGKLKEPGTAPNCVSSEQGVQPERAVAPLTGTRAEMIDALRETGGTITSESDSYISATYMSSIFKFVDDVELRHAGGALWHIRSGSRVGYSDRGVNRKRVEDIRDTLGH
ncbi:DUF1499 domain-containing protein [Litorimonas sp. RW-G-Af-16]|uniref:DUF1499 domain-containing protein n=1 Tax=Litorimonas sp. RW-G-Af-16 TaxID=3241168 RepID=UPI00390C6DBD